MKNPIEQYLDYNRKIGDRKELYRVVAETFGVERALYPGSHVDISPSLVIPQVVYIDNFNGAIQFFKQLQVIQDYIDGEKIYDKACEIVFFGENYEGQFDIEKVDLIISQYAGFVGQATKRYLREGGILLANDSHGDATLAYLDEAYEFIGIVDSHHQIVTSDLEQYFTFARSREIDLDQVRRKMKGPKYKTQAGNYLFRLKNQVL